MRNIKTIWWNYINGKILFNSDCKATIYGEIKNRDPV